MTSVIDTYQVEIRQEEARDSLSQPLSSVHLRNVSALPSEVDQERDRTDCHNECCCSSEDPSTLLAWWIAKNRGQQTTPLDSKLKDSSEAHEGAFETTGKRRERETHRSDPSTSCVGPEQPCDPRMRW